MDHLNVRAKNIKHEHIGENLNDLGFGKDFFIQTQKAQTIKGKINKLDFIKIQNFLLFKGHCYKNKKASHRPGENICKTYI